MKDPKAPLFEYFVKEATARIDALRESSKPLLNFEESLDYYDLMDMLDAFEERIGSLTCDEEGFREIHRILRKLSSMATVVDHLVASEEFLVAA